MEQAKHTPGTWHQGDDIRQIKSGNGIIVCNVSGAVSNPSVLADALLIAAAPELLEVLKKLASIDFGSNGWDEFAENAAREARAAIAKATGA